MPNNPEVSGVPEDPDILGSEPGGTDILGQAEEGSSDILGGTAEEGSTDSLGGKAEEGSTDVLGGKAEEGSSDVFRPAE
jgi:hypothetical protein